MKQIFACILFTLFLIQPIFSQKSDKKGYVILNDGTKISGVIENSSKKYKNNPLNRSLHKKVKMTSDKGNRLKFKPTDVKYFVCEKKNQKWVSLSIAKSQNPKDLKKRRFLFEEISGEASLYILNIPYSNGALMQAPSVGFSSSGFMVPTTMAYSSAWIGKRLEKYIVFEEKIYRVFRTKHYRELLEILFKKRPEDLKAIKKNYFRMSDLNLVIKFFNHQISLEQAISELKKKNSRSYNNYIPATEKDNGDRKKAQTEYIPYTQRNKKKSK